MAVISHQSYSEVALAKAKSRDYVQIKELSQHSYAEQ